MAADADDSLGVLDRVTSILEAFDDDDRGLGISELALRAGLPKSTVSRLVATLVRQRYLERDGKRISLGLRLFELGQLAEQPRELRVAAHPVMADLRNKTGASVHLAIRDGDEMVCIAAMRGRGPAPLTARIGGRLPLHATALGKAVLAHSGTADVDAVLSSALVPWTPHTIVDPGRLRTQLAAIRRGDLAVEAGEFFAGVCCVATPVFSPSGRLVAAISVSAPAEGLDADAVAPAVRVAASSLAHRLPPGAPGERGQQPQRG